MTEPKWPVKPDMTQHYYDFNNGFESGERVMHDKFMEVIKAQPKGLVALDERTIRLIMDLGRMTERPGDARDIQRIVALWDWPTEIKEEMLSLIGLHDSRVEAIGKLIRFMISTFGTTPKAEVMSLKDISVEEIYEILYEQNGVVYMESSEDPIDRTRAEVMKLNLNGSAQAIYQHLKERKP